MPESGQGTRSRTNTMPTTISTRSSLSFRSKKMLIYDWTDNAVYKLSRKQFDQKYSRRHKEKSDLQRLTQFTDISPEDITIIPIPKNAAQIDISPTDMGYDFLGPPRPSSSGASSPEEMARQSRPRPYSTSYLASIHIPNSVFFQRAFFPDKYSDLVVITSKIGRAHV